MMSLPNSSQQNVDVPQQPEDSSNCHTDSGGNENQSVPENIPSSGPTSRSDIWCVVYPNRNYPSPVVPSTGAPAHNEDTSVPDGQRLCSRRRLHTRVNCLLDFQGQWKGLKRQHGQWTCFLCCHVRSGTIAIGCWHMILHFMALALIAIALIHPEMLSPVNRESFDGEQLEVTENDVQDVQAVNCSEMPCLLAAQGDDKLSDAVSDFPLSIGNLLSTHRLNAEDINVALFITLCTFIVTMLLIYGAFKDQPSHLMPFFFLQVFDFCITCMTMFGYLSYLPNVRQMIAESSIFPFRLLQHQLLSMNTKCLTFFVIMVFVVTFMIKAYCINIVWRCYKYLMQRTQGGPWPLRPRMRHHATSPVDQESQTLVFGHELPDYNTAVTDPQFRKKTSRLFPEPPPSYDMAMAAFYAQQQIISEAQNVVPITDHAPLLGEPSCSTTVDATDGHHSAAEADRSAGLAHGNVASSTTSN